LISFCFKSELYSKFLPLFGNSAELKIVAKVVKFSNIELEMAKQSGATIKAAREPPTKISTLMF